MTQLLNRTIYYNVGNPKPALVIHDLVHMLKEYEPVMEFLCEIGDRHSELKEVAKRTGYKLHIGEGEPGADRLAVLIHPDVEVYGVRTFKISDRTFVGFNTAGAKAQGGYAAAKYIIRVRFKYQGRVRVRAGTHLVPSAMKRGNKRTRRLHRKQVDAVVKFLKQRKRLFEATVGGDMNADPSRPGERELLVPLINDYHYVTDVTHKKRMIDIAFSNKRMESKALKGYHSDHKPLLVTHFD